MSPQSNRLNRLVCETITSVEKNDKNIMKTEYLALAGIASAALVAAQTAQAAFVHYTDWTSATVGIPGSASGTVSDGFNSVGVTYSGEVSGPTQLGAPGDTFYWTQPNPGLPPYTGNAVVGNAPTTTDIIALVGQNANPITQTITFSQPVQNPILLILSLGQPRVTVNYNFDSSFTLLSSGQGYWGGGAGGLTQSGNVLTGEEGHGALQFNGMVSSISWTAAQGEYWHGFTVGLTAVPAVPEPATMIAGALLLLPFGASTLRILRKNRAA